MDGDRLPSAPWGDVFRTREALAHGITRGRLGGPGWSRVSHGIYARKSSGLDHPSPSNSPRREWLPRLLPADAAIAHLTAASHYAIPVPVLPPWLPILAVVPPGQLPAGASRLLRLPQPWCAAASGRRRGSARRCPGSLPGQPAEDLSLIDLVIALDNGLQRRLCSVASLEDSIRSRQRGLPRLRQALALCDGRSESPWETILRLLHVTCGIVVEPQATILDQHAAFIARADLRIRGTRRLPEYDGAVHRKRNQHQADLIREKALSREGWERYGYVAKEILGNPERVLRDAEEALGLPHDLRRLAGWRPLVAESSLSPEGRARLMAPAGSLQPATARPQTARPLTRPRTSPSPHVLPRIAGKRMFRRPSCLFPQFAARGGEGRRPRGRRGRVGVSGRSAGSRSGTS